MKKDIHELIAEAFKKRDESEPLAKQILFDQKVKEATERIEAYAKSEIEKIEKRKTLFWKRVGVTFFILNMILLVASPWEIGNIVAEKVRENVIDPSVRESLDKIVKENASDYVNKQLTPFKATVDDLHNQLLNLKGTIAEAEDVSKQAQTVAGNLQGQSTALGEQVATLNSTLYIIGLIVRADHDDRKAFDLLLIEATNEKSPYQGICVEVILAISTARNLELSMQTSGLNWKSSLNIDPPDKLSPDEIKALMVKMVRADARALLLQYVWEQNRFTKYDKLDFSAWVIKNDLSIANVRDAMQRMDADSGIKKILFKYNDYLVWWDENKDKYKAAASTTAPPTTPH